MNKCRDCGFWGVLAEPKKDASGVICRRSICRGLSTRPDLTYLFVETKEGEHIAGLLCTLLTHADFGCILWKGKEEK